MKILWHSVKQKNLRKKMKAAGTQAEIKAVYGFGYKLAFDMP